MLQRRFWWLSFFSFNYPDVCMKLVWFVCIQIQRWILGTIFWHTLITRAVCSRYRHMHQYFQVERLPNMVHFYFLCRQQILIQFKISTKKINFVDLNVNWKDIRVFQYGSILIFLYGSWVQYQAHVGLSNLRKGKGRW